MAGLTTNPLFAVPFSHDCTMFRTAKVCHTLAADEFAVTDPHSRNRVSSAITATVGDAGPSPSTTLPVVPALNGWVPSVAHTPPVPVCWLRVYAFDPPL